MFSLIASRTQKSPGQIGSLPILKGAEILEQPMLKHKIIPLTG